MTVTAVRKDIEALMLEVEAEFPAPPERIWQLFADPRQLERWWGPPDYPATVTAHELQVGGRIAYHMTSPEGEQYPGYWIVREVEPPSRLVFQDGFVGEDGQPDEGMPTTVTTVRIEDLGNGTTRMTLTSDVPDQAAMESLLEMGADEGLSSAIGQIDGILAEDASA
jgi:uncharacterized protein YndB with AHSA1/START domain